MVKKMWLLPWVVCAFLSHADGSLFEYRFAHIPQPSWGRDLDEKDYNSLLPYFFIVVPTYNNEALCIANIKSVLKQKYPHWRLHIVDDCSSDKTFELLTHYIAQLPHELQNKITLVRNIHRRKALYNLWFSITHYCKPSWIVTTLDGDDELAHEYVLDRVAQEYTNTNVGATHGQYVNKPRGTRGTNEKVPDIIAKTNRFRDYQWVTSHLRTFKAWTFHQIKLEDLMIDGMCYPMAWDLAIMFPILEQLSEIGNDGKPHFRFIPDILYFYNETAINDWKVDYSLIAKLDRIIRSQPRYQPVSQPVVIDVEALSNERADLVMFSFDRPLQLEALLRSVRENMTGLDRQTVIYRASSDAFEKGYEKLMHAFPEVEFVRQSRTHPHDDFKPLTLDIVFGSPSKYILFAVDDDIVKDEVKVSECIVALEKTHAYSFYLKMGQHVSHCYTVNAHQGVPPLLPVTENIYVWQFYTGLYDWKYPNTVDMALYRKGDLRTIFAKLFFSSPNTFEGQWSADSFPNLRSIGLCYEQSKIINIPLNRVQRDFSCRNMNLFTPEQLLEKFNKGDRIDFRSLLGIKNKSVHTEWTPQFFN
jgi:glycosyltransferase involved in cell wall biosynthesis